MVIGVPSRPVHDAGADSCQTQSVVSPLYHDNRSFTLQQKRETARSDKDRSDGQIRDISNSASLCASIYPVRGSTPLRTDPPEIARETTLD